MKIKFNDGREYEVFSVIYHMDKNNEPIDIVIYSTEEILEQIAECASVGVNIQECNWDNVFQSGVWKHYSDHVYEALYARLEPFTIIHAGRVQYDI